MVSGEHRLRFALGAWVENDDAMRRGEMVALFLPPVPRHAQPVTKTIGLPVPSSAWWSSTHRSYRRV
jgi:hypothetical protein